MKDLPALNKLWKQEDAELEKLEKPGMSTVGVDASPPVAGVEPASQPSEQAIRDSPKTGEDDPGGAQKPGYQHPQWLPF